MRRGHAGRPPRRSAWWPRTRAGGALVLVCTQLRLPRAVVQWCSLLHSCAASLVQGGGGGGAGAGGGGAGQGGAAAVPGGGWGPGCCVEAAAPEKHATSIACKHVPLQPPAAAAAGAPPLQAAAREAERLRQEREAQRKEYEEQQARMGGWGAAATGAGRGHRGIAVPWSSCQPAPAPAHPSIAGQAGCRDRGAGGAGAPGHRGAAGGGAGGRGAAAAVSQPQSPAACAAGVGCWRLQCSQADCSPEPLPGPHVPAGRRRSGGGSWRRSDGGGRRRSSGSGARLCCIGVEAWVPACAWLCAPPSKQCASAAVAGSPPQLACQLAGRPPPTCRSEEAIRRKVEERRRLEREKKRFGVRLEGSLAVERPPKVRWQTG